MDYTWEEFVIEELMMKRGKVGDEERKCRRGRLGMHQVEKGEWWRIPASMVEVCYRTVLLWSVFVVSYLVLGTWYLVLGSQ